MPDWNVTKLAVYTCQPDVVTKVTVRPLLVIENTIYVVYEWAHRTSCIRMGSPSMLYTNGFAEHDGYMYLLHECLYHEELGTKHDHKIPSITLLTSGNARIQTRSFISECLPITSLACWYGKTCIIKESTSPNHGLECQSAPRAYIIKLKLNAFSIYSGDKP